MRRFTLIFLPVLLLTLLGLNYVLVQARAVPPVYQPMPDFSGTDRQNKPFSNKDLSGKVWVSDFIFTRCAGQCPLMTQKMKRLHEKLKFAYFVSYSVDPAYDTPARLSDYASDFEAESGRWLFVTGKPADMDQLTKELHMNTTENPMLHSVSFVLVDAKGQVRGFYNAEDEEKLKQLEKDVHRLLGPFNFLDR